MNNIVSIGYLPVEAICSRLAITWLSEPRYSRDEAAEDIGARNRECVYVNPVPGTVHEVVLHRTSRRVRRRDPATRELVEARDMVD